MDVIDDSILNEIARILEWDIEEKDPHFEPLYLLARTAEEVGLDYIEVPPSLGEMSIDADHVKDRYGCVYVKSEHGMKVIREGPINDISDLKGFDMASKIEEDDFLDLRYMLDLVGDHKAVGSLCMDPFKISWLLRGGMQNLLVDFALNPDFVHALARISTDFNLAVIDITSRMGVEVVSMDGDLASEQNTIMSPVHYREFIKPYQQELVEFAHNKGMKVFKHSDGNVWKILDDFVEVGFDGYHPIQPQCMDIAEVKEHFGGRICLIGNIDCRELLCDGSEEEVEEAVKIAINIAAPGGGYILASSNSIHPGVKTENFLAMVRAAHSYGIYNSLD
jgi:uroporphyrinogen decarboxylase